MARAHMIGRGGGAVNMVRFKTPTRLSIIPDWYVGRLIWSWYWGKRRHVFEWWRILAYSNVKMRSSCAGFSKGIKHGVWIRRQPKVHPSRLRSHPENPEQCRLYLLSQDLQVEVGDTSGPFCETVMRSISVGLWVWVWPEGFWKLQTWTLEPLAVSHILLHVFHWFSLKEAKLEKKEEASL